MVALSTSLTSILDPFLTFVSVMYLVKNVGHEPRTAVLLSSMLRICVETTLRIQVFRKVQETLQKSLALESHWCTLKHSTLDTTTEENYRYGAAGELLFRCCDIVPPHKNSLPCMILLYCCMLFVFSQFIVRVGCVAVGLHFRPDKCAPPSITLASSLHSPRATN